jgi:ketosteroid isomerase-like protein
MSEDTNEQTVRQIYRDFLNGNIHAIIDTLADNVRWFVSGYPDVPFAGSFKGKAEVIGYFQNKKYYYEYLKYEPREFFKSGDTIVVIGYQEGTALKTSRKVSTEWAMRWEFNPQGKVVDFRFYDDSNKIAKACKEEVYL